MAITILAPTPAVINYQAEQHSDDDSDDGGVDLEGDLDMRPKKRAKHGQDVVTPGETVTDDPQWMRYNFSHSSYTTNCSTNVFAEVTEHSLHPPAQKL
jgi:exosome complex component RRP4